jgi:hypothetical protein
MHLREMQMDFDYCRNFKNISDVAQYFIWQKKSPLFFESDLFRCGLDKFFWRLIPLCAFHYRLYFHEPFRESLCEIEVFIGLLQLFSTSDTLFLRK